MIMKKNVKQRDLFLRENERLKNLNVNLTPDHTIPEFSPDRIILAKDSMSTPERILTAQRICSYFPQADIEEHLDTPHNRINLCAEKEAFKRHVRGKKTLVLGVMKSPVRLSNESGNTCPNYWHYSVFGFCPFECAYCYLAGTPGVWYSPSVKIYVNLPDIIDSIDRNARTVGSPVAFYHGKLQDGLALEPVTGYMRTLIPFFANHPYARNIVLTKSNNVKSLWGLST